MNTQSYTAEDIIAGLSKNIKGVIKMAYENYEIGSRNFNALINASVEPLKIVNELLEAQKTANKRLKQNVLKKAKGDLEEETLNRLNDFLAKTNTTNER